MDMTGDYTKKDYPTGAFEKSFELGCGEKKVAIFMPWSVPAQIEELSVEDGSYVVPIARNKKMLVFGDSITRVYDALHSSKHYISILAECLQADVYNKGIGGERFIPALAATDEDFVADYIVVAYGTNDWSQTDMDTFKLNCKAFYEILSKKYPTSKIFALTPIWRKDYEVQRNCGEFSFVAEYIQDIAAGLENVYCVNGFDFVPHREEMFGDLKLHPNEEGFKYFAHNVYEAIHKEENRK